MCLFFLLFLKIAGAHVVKNHSLQKISTDLSYVINNVVFDVLATEGSVILI